MLELRPNCEWCDRNLPPSSREARICSYECTYCVTCAEGVLNGVCPTCGGNFAPRPIRPVRSWREDLKLGLIHHPESDKRRHSRWTPVEAEAFTARLKAIDPSER